MTKFARMSVVALMAVICGCSKIVPKLDEVIPDNRREYVKAQTLPDLEVPPDLSTEAIRDRMAIPEGGESARYSSYQERRAAQKRADELERAETSAIRVLENEHVVAVAGAPVQVWPRLSGFWESEGYSLDLNDAELGIIETGWSEDEAQLMRDKFKVFAEPGEETGTTVLYISHEGQELVPDGEDLVWKPRPRNADLERETVERLLTELSGQAPAAAPKRVATPETRPAPAETPAVAEAEADRTAPVESAPAAAPTIGEQAGSIEANLARHAELVSVGGGKFYLTVAEDFPKAWKTTGRALEEVGMDVKDSDKGRGVYIVEVAGQVSNADDTGMWNKLKFWDRGDAAEYQVSLTGVGEKTEVVVLDKNGRWETGDQAGAILNKLHDALNSGRI